MYVLPRASTSAIRLGRYRRKPVLERFVNLLTSESLASLTMLPLPAKAAVVLELLK